MPIHIKMAISDVFSDSCWIGAGSRLFAVRKCKLELMLRPREGHPCVLNNAFCPSDIIIAKDLPLSS